MNKTKLRKKIPLSYYEPEEPSFDEYIYCDQCRDYVYDYCSIHGPLLVIPDDEVPIRTGYPSFVPRAALTIPREFLHIAPSIIPGAGLGVFSTLTLPQGVQFGPYRGRKTNEAATQYCWKIKNTETRYSHLVDASDVNVSNWMRYVNCARHWHEQNLVAYQHRGQIYYRTIKIIPRFTELLVFYGSEFAIQLNIDLRNYNSEDYRQIVACRRPVIGEDTNTDLNFEEENRSTHDYDLPTAIQDFFIIDTPEDSKDSVIEENTNNKLNETQISANNTLTTSDHDLTTSDKALTTSYNALTTWDNALTTSYNALTCHICKKVFNKRYNLTRHLRTHNIFGPTMSLSDINDFKCNICLKSFTDRSTVKKHLKLHENKSHTTLKYQEINHEVENGFQCYICHKTLYHFKNLKRHYELHGVNKNELNTRLQNLNKFRFKCNKCGKMFTRPKALNQHKLTHNIEKLYKCTNCCYETNYLRYFKAHIQSHTGKFLYYCDLCSYCGNERSYIIRHQRKHHK